MARRYKPWAVEIAAALLVVILSVVYFTLREPLESAPRIVLFFGRFHPLAVHLPIGILLLVAFGEALSLSPTLRGKIDPSMVFVLPALVVTSVGSFVLGQLLATGGGFPTGLVDKHRSLTFAAVIGTVLCFVLFRRSAHAEGNGLRLAYRAALLGTVGVLSIGAHHGGSITRGEGYLAKYAPAPLRGWLGPEERPDEPEQPPRATTEPLVFADVIAPILESRCVECHGPDQTKGGLRVDSMAALLKGGESGPAILSSNGVKSPLVARMLLPEDDDERMPPDGKPGPSAEEIALIRWWIDRGASETMRVRDALVSPASRSVLERSVASSSTSADTPPVASPPSSDSASVPPSTSSPVSAEPITDPTGSADPGASVVHTSLVSADDGVYSARVAPILAARCGRCHGATKKKGKLRTDSIASLLTGGKAGPAVVAGSSSSGTLLARVHLPLAHSDHMPPADEPQMTAREIALVAFWIDQGASANTKMSALPAELQNVFVPRAPRTAPPVKTSAAPVATATLTTMGPTPSAASPSATAPSSATAVSPPELATLPKSVHLHRDLVAPILEDRCGACHSSSTSQGDLDVGSVETMLTGGSSGPAIVPGDPSKSLLLERMKLPLEDDEHMPPESMPQPSSAELAALELWIASGADATREAETASLSPEVRVLLEEKLRVAQATAAESPSTPPDSAAPPRASATASSRPPDDGDLPGTGPGAGCASCRITGRDEGARPASGLFAIAAAITLGLRRACRRVARA